MQFGTELLRHVCAPLDSNCPRHFCTCSAVHVPGFDPETTEDAGKQKKKKPVATGNDHMGFSAYFCKKTVKCTALQNILTCEAVWHGTDMSAAQLFDGVLVHGVKGQPLKAQCLQDENSHTAT